jgi:DNA-binding SARP family transcriptional activator
MHRLIVLGGIHLESPPGSPPGRTVQPRPLALLALLDRSGGIPLTRAKAVGLLWPDVPEPSARRRLSDLVYILRTGLGRDAVVSVADRLLLDPDVVASDAAAFEAALADGRTEDAVRRYGGRFLDGFYLAGNPHFDLWAEGERRVLAEEYARALERLAQDRESTEDWSDAAAWWRQRAEETPTDSRVAMRLMRALAHSGNVPGALEQAREHAAVLRAELGLPLPDEVRDLARELA